MYKKRGQATFFIIIGIVLIIALFLAILLRSQFAEDIGFEEIGQKIKISPVKNLVNSCLKETSELAAFTISYHGGYVEPRTNYTEFNGKKIPYYDNSFPLREDIEEEFSNYIMREIHNCLNFSVFREYEFIEPDSSMINTNTRISPKTFTVELIYPLIVISGDTKTEISEFSTTLPIRLGELHQNALDLLNQTDVNLSDPSNCNKYYGNGLTNIYYKLNDAGQRQIIQFMDYDTFERYTKTFIFQFAVKEANIIGTRCVPER
jgi:hypothetical protein